MWDPLQNTDNKNNRWITSNRSNGLRQRKTEEMIHSFHSQLRRLEKRLKICSDEQHNTSCLCPWAIENADLQTEGGILATSSTTNLQRAGESRFIKHQTQEYMRAARSSHVRGEIVNKSPEHTEPRCEVRSDFPPPASPSPISDPSPLWDTVLTNLQHVPSSTAEPEPLVLPARSPNFNLRDIYKVKSPSSNITTSPSKSQVRPPFITASSPSKIQVRPPFTTASSPSKSYTRPAFQTVTSPSKISTVDSSVQTSGFFQNSPFPVKQVKSAVIPELLRPAENVANTPKTTKACKSLPRRQRIEHPPHIRARHMALVPSPPQGSPRLIGFSQRGERPKRKLQQLVAVEEHKHTRSKPLITPSTWREELKSQKQKKPPGTAVEKKDENYSDDEFESDDDDKLEKDDKENHSPKTSPVAKKSFRHSKPRFGPPTPSPPGPKIRHYNPNTVQSYMNKKKQQRASHSKELNLAEKIKMQQRESQLKALQIRAKRIVAASIRKQRQMENVPKNTPRQNFDQSFTSIKSPSSSLNSSIKSNSNKLSDEFIETFVNLHGPRPKHPKILSILLEKEDKELAAQKNFERSQKSQASEQQEVVDTRSPCDMSQKSQPEEHAPQVAFTSLATRDKVVSPQRQGSPPSVAAARSTAKLIQQVITSVRAENAATKIQAVYRGYRIRQHTKKIIKINKSKPKSVPISSKIDHINSKMDNILDSWISKNDADPFNFIQSVKRKLSEATKTDTQEIYSKNIETKEKYQTPVEDKYESDFESSVLSASPSEDINIGSDSRASRHSLASITPDRNDEISALTNHPSRPESPQPLVAPSVALVVPTDTLTQGTSSTSSKSSSNSPLLSTTTDTQAAAKYSSSSVSSGVVSKDKPNMVQSQSPPVMEKSNEMAIKIAPPQQLDTVDKFVFVRPILVEKETQYTLQSPLSHYTESSNVGKAPIALSNSDASIQELEMSIEAGFGRLTDEINAVRKMFGLPCTENDIPLQAETLKFSTAFPQLNLPPSRSQAPTFNNEAFFTKPLHSSTITHMSSSSHKESEEEVKHNSKTEQSSSTLTECGVKDSEMTLSNGIRTKRVTEHILTHSNVKNLAHEDESLDEISEHVSEEYSSKFEEMESEEAGSARSVAFSSTTQTASELLTEVKSKDRGVKTKAGFRSAVSSSDSQRQGTSSTGSTEQDSFTVFSLAMFQQLVRDQELRARHQRALLKQREDAIFDKSKAELILLENQKKQLRSTGMESLIPGIKKRQRAILMRLNQERDEIKRLRESHKMASQERRLMLQQQQHIARMRVAAKELTSKLQNKDLVFKSQRLLEPSRRPMGSEEESSDASLSLDTSDFSQSKASSGPDTEKGTTATLKDVLHKLKKVDKHRVLDVPTEKHDDQVHSSEVIESENNLQQPTDTLSVPIISTQPSLRDCSTSPLPPSEEIFTETQGEVEEVVTSQLSVPTQSVIDEIQEERLPSPSILEVSSLEPKQYTTDSFESINNTSSVQDTINNKEKSVVMVSEPPKIVSLRPPVTIKVPLSPRLQGKQKRRHSSGSDESIVLSQPETASEQSDVESRICALQEQLRRRKMEAERLRREQKRCHRERLRAKEQSLLKQIQAYDSYIIDARRELEQEFEAGVTSSCGVKPQIKQPRVAEKNSTRKSECSESTNISTEIKSTDGISKVIEEENKDSVQIKSSPKLQTASQSEISTVSEATSVPTDSSIKEESSYRSKNESSVIEILEQESKKILTEEKISQISELEIKKGSQILEKAMKITPQILEQDDKKIAKTSEQEVMKSPQASEKEVKTEPKILEQVFERNKDSLEGLEKEIKNPLQILEEQVLKDASVLEKEVDTAPLIFETQDEAALDILEQDIKKESLTFVETNVSTSQDISESIKSEISEDFEEEENEEEEEEEKEPLALESIPQVEPEVKTDTVEPIVPNVPESVPELEVENKVDIVPDAPSQESGSGDTSVETTIESPRRGVGEEGAKKEDSEEDIAESLPDTSASSDELQEDAEKQDKEKEIAKITDYLLQQLISDNINVSCTKVQSKRNNISEEISKAADKIAEILSQELLEEALNEIWAIFKEKKTESSRLQDKPKSPTHSILERVQSLLAVAETSSPRDHFRPQNLMVTTYVEEILSPEPGLPELSPSKDGEVQKNKTEKLDKKSPSDEVALSKEVLGGDGAAVAKELESQEDGTTSPPQQDWFDEDFGLSSTRREAEELRLQQLQIEQEIQQLQAQQYPYYYVREIPNKPPPPYTPPGESLKSPEETEETPGAVPASQEKVLPLISRATETLYHARLAGRDLDTVQPSWEPEAEQDSAACQVYKHFLFDLSKQIVQEAYSCPDQDSPPWLEPPAVRRRKALLMPKTLQELQQRVEEQVMALLGFSKRPRREKLIIRWSRKRRDHVDELLVREAQEEEQAWTNYELDEAAVKSQMSDAMLNMLISDTASAVSKAIESKTSKLGEKENET